MKKEITELQKLMREEGIDVYYVPEADPHGSEMVNDHFKSCEFLSGLLAENEELVVTEDSAYIWTDSRFFIQAERELAGSGIQLMKMKEEGVPTVTEFLKDMIRRFGDTHESGSFVVGFDGSTMPAHTGLVFEKVFAELLTEDDDSDYGRVKLRYDEDLADRVWKDRPAVVPSKIWELPMTSAGRTAGEKLAQIRKVMEERGAGHLVLTDLTQPAWLLNLRGDDVKHTPVFFSYMLISRDSATLYVMDGALDDLKEKHGTGNCLPEALSDIIVKSYSDIFDDVAALPADEKIWMDPSTANYLLWISAPNEENIIAEETPVAAAKAVKNDAEISAAFRTHVKDGIAVTKFIKWLKDRAACCDEEGYLTDPETGRHLTEIAAAEHLDANRFEQDGCFDLSFGTIPGYGPNGAVVHYAPSPETDLEIKGEGFLLVDSGGQYTEGTTDITRTIAVGPLTQQMIDNYTLVLKGHIALAGYVVMPDTTFSELDYASREALRSAGLEFGHGVSHGVGHVLSVHEHPGGIERKEGPCGFKAGMMMSNEPGYYEAGEYGIRIENVILMEDGAAEGYPEGSLVSRNLTCVPYERAAINRSLLTEDEIAWVDSYHAWVRETLTPLLDDETAEFVRQQTMPL